MKNIILLFLVITTNSIFANEKFEFVRECIKSYDLLDKATLTFSKQLEDFKNNGELKTATMKYVDVLMKTQNMLLPYSKSELSDVKEVTIDLRKLMVDLVKENYSFLSTLNEEKIEKKSADKFKKKLEFVTGFFNQISLGVCMTLTKEKAVKEENKQYSILTTKQKSELNQLLIKSFGKSIKKGQKSKSNTAFEASSKIIYEFLNMSWEYSKKD